MIHRAIRSLGLLSLLPLMAAAEFSYNVITLCNTDGPLGPALGSNVVFKE